MDEPTSVLTPQRRTTFFSTEKAIENWLFYFIHISQVKRNKKITQRATILGGVAL